MIYFLNPLDQDQIHGHIRKTKADTKEKRIQGTKMQNHIHKW